MGVLAGFDSGTKGTGDAGASSALLAGIGIDSDSVGPDGGGDGGGTGKGDGESVV